MGTGEATERNGNFHDKDCYHPKASHKRAKTSPPERSQDRQRGRNYQRVGTFYDNSQSYSKPPAKGEISEDFLEEEERENRIQNSVKETTPERNKKDTFTPPLQMLQRSRNPYKNKLTNLPEILHLQVKGKAQPKKK